MCSIIVGIFNTLVFFLSCLGAFFSNLPNEVRDPVVGFFNKYFSWYLYDLKIAHALSIIAMVYLIILLIRQKINFLTCFIGIFLNFVWMTLYMFLVWN